MRQKLLILPLLLLAGLFTGCDTEDPTQDDFVKDYVKLHVVYYEMLKGEAVFAFWNIDLDCSTYIQNAIDEFDGSIKKAFYTGNGITDSSPEKAMVDMLIKAVKSQKINLVITEDDRPNSCKIKDTESDLSFLVTYSGGSMYISEINN